MNMSMVRANPKKYELEARASAEHRAIQPERPSLARCACDEEAASHNFDKTWLQSSPLMRDRSVQRDLHRKSIEIGRAQHTGLWHAPCLWPCGSDNNDNAQTEETEIGSRT
jgi:hypothetical protein